MNDKDFAEMNLEAFLPFLVALRATKRPVSVAPTHTPKNLLDQLVLYENGATIRLYLYVAGTWRYTALT